jgi:hypothetical protein
MDWDKYSEFLKECRNIRGAAQARSFLDSKRAFLESCPNTAPWLRSLDQGMAPDKVFLTVAREVLTLTLAKPSSAATSAKAAKAATIRAPKPEKLYVASIFSDGVMVATTSHDKGSQAFRWVDRNLIDVPNSHGVVTFNGGSPVTVDRDGAFRRVLGRQPGKPGVACKGDKGRRKIGL